jgi:hypothetical protein
MESGEGEETGNVSFILVQRKWFFLNPECFAPALVKTARFLNLASFWKLRCSNSVEVGGRVAQFDADTSGRGATQ